MKHSRLCFLLILALATTALVAQNNPVPLLYQLSPASGKPGHAAFTMRVHGTGFVAGAVARWNNQPLTTKFISQSVVAVTIPASLVAQKGTASLTVANPAGIASNVIYFPIRSSAATVALTADPASIEHGSPAVGDFNHNGIPDISIFGSDDVNAYLDTYFGNGHGGFHKVAGVFLQDYNPNFLCGPNISADFNNDGILDVAACVANGDGNDPAIYLVYLGDAQGGFTAATSRNSWGVGAVADMNGDGILDFVTLGYFSGPPEFTVFLGNGDGTFTDAGVDIIPNAGGTPIVGDFNGDGKLDVAVPSAGLVAVFLGNGDGTVQNEVDYPISGGASDGGNAAIAIDVNGDGKLDIVTSSVSVLLGNGDGTFANTFSVPVNSRAAGEVRVGDFNGDGKLDLAVPALNFGNNQAALDILLGNGNGTFQDPQSTVVSNFLIGYVPLGMADFNNDGALDFVIGGFSPTVVLLQTAPK